MDQSQSKKNNAYVIRKPTASDAQAIIHYSKLLFSSTDQVLTLPEEYKISIEDEKTWINTFNANPNALALVAETAGNIIGFLFFIPHPKKKVAHTGEFGVSVDPQFQKQGIGKALVDALLIWAVANPVIEKVFLNVFASNTHAIKLYHKLGFKEEGRFVRAVKQPDGAYVDVLQMYVLTKSN